MKIKIYWSNEQNKHKTGLGLKLLLRKAIRATLMFENFDQDAAVSVTGLAGPDGDEFGNPVGTVFIGYADGRAAFAREYHFEGDRADVREQTICAALSLVLEQNQ